MVSIERILRIDLPPRQSAFLWGPRKTGKRAGSALIRDGLKNGPGVAARAEEGDRGEPSRE